MQGKEEEFVAEEDAENSSAALKRLREKLALAVTEKQEYLEGWQRARADFANFKREEGERDQEKDLRNKQAFAESIIPALDAFEMAFKSPSFQQASSEWKAGMSSVYAELLKSLSKFGIMSFSPVGEPFDPKEHEAVREVLVANKAQNHSVVSVERSGYRLGERIVRPAQVSVGIFTKE